MRHAGRARREDRQAGAALALQLELRALDARAQLVVADLQGPARRLLSRILDAGDLRFAEIVQLLRLGRVVAVTVDDHDASQDRRKLAQPLPNALASRHRVENPRCAAGNRQYGVPSACSGEVATGSPTRTCAK